MVSETKTLSRRQQGICTLVMRHQSLLLFVSSASCLLLLEKEGTGTPGSRVEFSFCYLQSHDSAKPGRSVVGVEMWGQPLCDSCSVMDGFSVVRFTQPFNISFR